MYDFDEATQTHVPHEPPTPISGYRPTAEMSERELLVELVDGMRLIRSKVEGLDLEKLINENPLFKMMGKFF